MEPTTSGVPVKVSRDVSICATVGRGYCAFRLPACHDERHQAALLCLAHLLTPIIAGVHEWVSVLLILPKAGLPSCSAARRSRCWAFGNRPMLSIALESLLT